MSINNEIADNFDARRAARLASITNTRVMAAAPELLAALEGLLAAPDLNLDGLEAETISAIRAARAAIAKAKGAA